MLGAEHNNNTLVAVSTRWDDFYNFTWNQDGTCAEYNVNAYA
jgi:hypothetical protein